MSLNYDYLLNLYRQTCIGYIFYHTFEQVCYRPLPLLQLHMKLSSTLVGLCLAGVSCKQTAPAGPQPVANFSCYLVAPMGVAIQMQNSSTDASSYMWQWGDGTSSTGQAPSHTYQAAGTKRLLLTATGPGGTDTLSRVVRITSDPAASSIAGTYKGRLKTRSYGGATAPSSSQDATIQITATDNNTLSVFNRTVPYKTSIYPWNGYKPERAHYDFLNNASYGATTSLQKEMYGDSIYVYASSGGLGGGTTTEFFGKKQY